MYTLYGHCVCISQRFCIPLFVVYCRQISTVRIRFTALKTKSLFSYAKVTIAGVPQGNYFYTSPTYHKSLLFKATRALVQVVQSFICFFFLYLFGVITAMCQPVPRHHFTKVLIYLTSAFILLFFDWYSSGRSGFSRIKKIVTSVYIRFLYEADTNVILKFTSNLFQRSTTLSYVLAVAITFRIQINQISESFLIIYTIFQSHINTLTYTYA